MSEYLPSTIPISRSGSAALPSCALIRPSSSCWSVSCCSGSCGSPKTGGGGESLKHGALCWPNVSWRCPAAFRRSSLVTSDPGKFWLPPTQFHLEVDRAVPLDGREESRVGHHDENRVLADKVRGELVSGSGHDDSCSIQRLACSRSSWVFAKQNRMNRLPCGPAKNASPGTPATPVLSNRYIARSRPVWPGNRDTSANT